MYRPHDVHLTRWFSGRPLIGLLATLVCLPACGERVVVARELSLESPDAAAPAPDAGSRKTPPPHKRSINDHDAKHDDKSQPPE